MEQGTLVFYYSFYFGYFLSFTCWPPESESGISFRSGGRPLQRSGLPGTCGKRYYHLAMVVVRDEDFFAERGTVE